MAHKKHHSDMGVKEPMGHDGEHHKHHEKSKHHKTAIRTHHGVHGHKHKAK